MIIFNRLIHRLMFKVGVLTLNLKPQNLNHNNGYKKQYIKA